MTISRTLASVALAALCGCGVNGMDGKLGVAGVPGPEGPGGQSGSNGADGTNGSNGVSGADIALPGPSFYPESITALSNGTLYIGSLALGQIYKFMPGAQIPVKFVDAAAGLKQVGGVLADEANNLLYACTVDNSNNVAVLSFGLADGLVSKTYTMPATTKCNDMAFDGNGNLFVTDSTGIIYKLDKNGTTLNSWLSGNMQLQPATAGTGFGADGIVYEPTNNYLFVNNFEKGKISRITINADGTAGTVDDIVVTPAVVNPDGMRLIDATTLVVAENTFVGMGRLSKLTIDNTAKTAAKTVIDNRLDGPTSFVKVGMIYWITEGQLGQLFGAMNPNLPFYVRRVPSFL